MHDLPSAFGGREMLLRYFFRGLVATLMWTLPAEAVSISAACCKTKRHTRLRNRLAPSTPCSFHSRLPLPSVPGQPLGRASNPNVAKSCESGVLLLAVT